MIEDISAREQASSVVMDTRHHRWVKGFARWVIETVGSVATWQLLAVAPVRSIGGLVDLTLYGGAYESSSTVSYAEVVQKCFGGLAVGSCEPSSPNGLKDFLDQYNGDSTGAYCTGCCSNSDTSGNTWTFDCALISTDYVDYVNHFGWEFRFGRRETSDDTGVITCPIRRRSCSYDDDGVLTETCRSDGSFLTAYVLTMEVMSIKKDLKTWKSVQRCSVEVEEATEEPSSLSETIAMIQVYRSDRAAIEPGWAVLISLVAFCVLSFVVRFLRDDRCVICGHHLIWFWEVCFPCRFYGYDPPSKAVKEIIKEKRSVVLPHPTLPERIGTIKATTSKVFVQMTKGVLTSLKIARDRNANIQQVSPETLEPDPERNALDFISARRGCIDN